MYWLYLIVATKRRRKMKLNKGIDKTFRREDRLEAEGVWFDFGDIQLKMARAGGSNKKYAASLAKRMKPYQGALQFDALPQETREHVIQEVYAESVLLDWKGVIDEEGNAIPFTYENVIDLLQSYPEIFNMVLTEATRFSNFKFAEDEYTVKNS
jgi:hypothetical protein